MRAKPAEESAVAKAQQWLLGIFFAVVLLKFGTPCVMDKFVTVPVDIWEWSLNSWPVRIGYWMLGAAAVLALFNLRLRTRLPLWQMLLPLSWLLWQALAATQSVDDQLSSSTLKHFAGVVLCFYIGLFCVGAWTGGALRFWLPIWLAFCVVLVTGFQQHFGGLEETRRYFYAYVYPQLDHVPMEYLQKMSSNRIFSTLFYPNALAGVLLLLTPAMLVLTLNHFTRFTLAARMVIAGALGVGALGCLFWSGSKAGWLLCVGLLAVALLHLNLDRSTRIAVVTVLVLAGAGGFIWKYSGFIQRGAPSAQARLDYWRAAAQTVRERPLFGSGPGTFGAVYQTIKRPEAEMARLTHNDYLQQASDSGIAGAVLFLGMVGLVLIKGHVRPAQEQGVLRFSVWLGFTAFALQSLVEFGGYIPALSWVAWMMGGWSLAQRE